jgi:hypothetical protein
MGACLMPEPTYSAATEAYYASLPEAYRLEDAKVDWTMKRFVSGILDQQGDIETLIDRFNFDALPDGVIGDTSDLVDPAVADAEWLPWLQQLVGLRTTSSSIATMRSRIASPTKFQGGTKAAIKEVVKNVLTGDKHVELYDHTTDVSALGGAGQWDVLIVTRATETVSSPITEVIRVGAKPAGIILYHRTYTTTWAAIEAAFPTWADMEGKTWNEIEEAGL